MSAVHVCIRLIPPFELIHVMQVHMTFWRTSRPPSTVIAPNMVSHDRLVLLILSRTRETKSFEFTISPLVSFSLPADSTIDVPPIDGSLVLSPLARTMFRVPENVQDTN
jgi:hypothetical protein